MNYVNKLKNRCESTWQPGDAYGHAFELADIKLLEQKKQGDAMAL